MKSAKERRTRLNIPVASSCARSKVSRILFSSSQPDPRPPRPGSRVHSPVGRRHLPWWRRQKSLGAGHRPAVRANIDCSDRPPGLAVQSDNPNGIPAFVRAQGVAHRIKDGVRFVRCVARYRISTARIEIEPGSFNRRSFSRSDHSAHRRSFRSDTSLGTSTSRTPPRARGSSNKTLHVAGCGAPSTPVIEMTRFMAGGRNDCPPPARLHRLCQPPERRRRKRSATGTTRNLHMREN